MKNDLFFECEKKLTTFLMGTYISGGPYTPNDIENKNGHRIKIQDFKENSQKLFDMLLPK